MNTDNKKLFYFGYYLSGVIGLFLALFVVFDRYNIVVNTTDSYPVGLYQKKVINRDIQRGDMVMFCLPKSEYTQLILDRGYLSKGFCDSRLTSLLKRVYAVTGDYVNASSKGLSVNHAQVIKNSIPLTYDIKGRALPLMESGIIPADHYVVFSEHNPRSFDSRYFGPIHKNTIHYFAKPLWIMGDIDEQNTENP
jgi:conjugative transfer signal peptidase TraF